jgi:putative ABC transport system permease protein
MTTLLHDLRYALRTMRKQPVFAAIAIVTLGLGIGANTAIFSVVHAVLLQPTAYPEAPDEVLVLTENEKNWRDELPVSYPNFKDWQSENRSFERLAGYQNGRYNLTGLDEPLRLRVLLISHGYFDIMGVDPLHGRFFSPDEDQPGAPGRVVFNYSLWQNRFGGDPSVIGSAVRLNDESYTIIGVLPSGFELQPRELAYIPLEPFADNDDTRGRGNRQGIRVLGRMRQGVTFDKARAEMETIQARLEAQHPDTNTGVGVNVERIHDRQVADYEATLLLLLGAVSLVLLIACTNVAQLLLARALGRRRELAIQVALGAGRRRLVQQSLTEGVLLALMGGALGLVLAFSGLGLLRNLLPTDVPGIHHVQISGPILVYSLAVSFLTGILFGAVPALVSARAQPMDPLKEGSRDTGGRRSTGRSLLVAEVALATVLLIGAGLLIRSIYELTRVDPGFRTERLLTMQIGLPESRYEGERRALFIQEMKARTGTLPGVTSAAVGLYFPMMGANWSSIFIVGDRPIPAPGQLPNSLFTPVETGFFETFGIPLLRGRTFLDSDDADASRVVVVNQALANQFWPNQNPIGKRLKQGRPERDAPWREIVGVVGDTKQYGLDEEVRMQTYMPVNQGPLWTVRLALRTAVEPLSVVASAKDIIRSMDPDLPVYEIETMDDIISASVAPRRFAMVLLGIFAALALVLAAIGLYGVIAYTVARRTQEIGLRVAMGAGRGDIFRLVVRHGMGPSLLGAVVGTLGALGLSQLLSSLLYGVGAKDPLTFSAVPVLLMAVAFIACAVPALAATRVEPIQALRYE